MQVQPFSLDKQLSDIGAELQDAVLKVLHSGQYIGGLEIKAFEDSFASSIGCHNVVGCNSGTDALILALRALKIGPGDEVITSSFSFFATAEAISNVGATPVFVDIENNGYLIDVNAIEAAITSKTKAILPVHLFGCPVDMERIMNLAKKHGLFVVEDCAQAAGAEWGGRSVGCWGDIGCFSFFPTKNLGAAGDGGAISTNNDQIAQSIRELAVHAMPRRYLHNDIGYNSRLDVLQAAILNVKLPKLPRWIEKRKEIAMRYRNALKDLPGIQTPNNLNNLESKHGWNQFVINVSNYYAKNIHLANDYSLSSLDKSINLFDSISRDSFKYDLEDLGVKTIIYYPIPIHLQPAYKELGYLIGSLPNTEKACSRVLSLPIFPEITLEQQNHVIESIKQLCSQSKTQKLASPMPSSNTFTI
tara:strand:- start:40 stop:1290 length:1251 start_codon:yes stop_codon:yes gene_type:complete